MNKSVIWTTLLVLLSGVALLSGCTNYSASHEYYKARPEAKLEIPPGLTRPAEDPSMEIPELQAGVTTYSAYAGECREQPGDAVLPPQQHIAIKREGNYLWMVVDAAPQQVWSPVAAFWENQGFKLRKLDPKLGLMETGWYEYREDGDALPVRDRYRLRFEYGAQPGSTEVYLSLQGQQLPAKGALWAPRQHEAELEVEMLKRLAAYLGASDIPFQEVQQTTAPIQLQDRAKQGLSLSIPADFKQSWRRAIKAMEAIDGEIQERDVNGKTLVANFTDPQQSKAATSSWLSNVVAPSDKHAVGRYRFEFFELEGRTELQIQTLQGKPATSARAKQVMEQLEQALSEL